MAVEQHHQELDQLPAAKRLAIDRVCTRFEDAWTAGSEPRIEDYFDATEECATVLLKELLLLDVYYRRRTGRDLTADSYRLRFPAYHSVVDEVFDRQPTDPPAVGGSTQRNLTGPTDVTQPEWGPGGAGPPPEIPGYEIREELAQGGMAVVYRAWDLRLNRQVALKLVAMANPSDEVVSRFRTEARAVANLQHSNIVEIHEIGEYEGRPYLALEFVARGNLAELARLSPQPPRAAARMVENLARAVAFAHRRGVVHRDLKPANVLVAGDAGDLEQREGEEADLPLLKIADFGLAKLQAEDSVQTHSGMLLGTPSYMAPEQALESAADGGPSADIYALGAILYELLAGRAPFKAATVLETLRLVREQPPPPLRQFQPQLPSDLETICLKCLAKQPQQRYASADDLAEDLRRFLHGEPIRARRAGRVERTWRWSQRHPGWALAIATLFVGMISVTALAVELARANRQLAGSLHKVREANDTAREQRNQARTAEQRERAARRQTERVLQTLISSLRSPDPARDGRTVTVAEILDRTAAELESGFPERPEETAQLWNAIGQTYLGLGLPARAVEVLESCLQLCEAHLGANHTDTRACRASLATALRAAGHMQLAIHHHEQVVQQTQFEGGPLHPAALASVNNLADAYQAVGQLNTAALLHERVLNAATASFGESDPRSLASMNNLAWVYTRLGRLDEAIELQQRALHSIREQLGEDHPQTLATKNNLALAFLSAGRLEESVEMLEEVLATARQRFGEEHPNTLSTMASLARGYRKLGRFAEAEALYLRAVDGRQRVLGADHLETLNARAGLAALLLETGRGEQAVEVYQEVLAGQEEQLGPSNPLVLMSMDNLGRAYWKTGELEKAEALLRDCLQRRDDPESSARQRHATVGLLGCVLVESGRWEEAERCLLSSYEYLEEHAPRSADAVLRRQQLVVQQLVELYRQTSRTAEQEHWQRIESQLTPTPDR